MKRKNYHIREDQIAFIDSHSDDTGLKKSEIIRQAIDLYIKTNKKKTTNHEKAT
ncbi:ribbon-helix-helix domain-containing protein [Fodinibius sp. SL11]|uniref:ribbon-helix-helix domain-containing protein n=1 Tax=Fodinibius sp. SL11 TaxID=3425690 RepID=UPI003F881D36